MKSLQPRTRPNEELVPTAEAPLSAMLFVTLTRHPVSMLTPAPAVGAAWTFAQLSSLR